MPIYLRGMIGIFFCYISSAALNPVSIRNFKPDKSNQTQTQLFALLGFVVLYITPNAYNPVRFTPV